MAFPPEVQTVTVRMGPLLSAGGEPVRRGTLMVTLSQTVHILSSGTILKSAEHATTGEDGIAEVTVAATDSTGLDRNNFTYRIFATGITPGGGIDVALPAAAPVVSVEDLAPAPQSDGTVVWVPPTGWVQDTDLAPVATSGAYADLTGTPTLAAVATTGDYTDLTGTPALAPVATSGDYADLTGSPALAPVATSGAYADLTGTPTLGTAAAADTTAFATAAQGTKADAALPAVRLGMVGERDEIAPRALTRKAAYPDTVSLITGSEDEVFGTANCTLTADTVNYRFGVTGWKMTTAAAVTNAYVLMSPVSPSTSGPLPIRPAQALCLWLYVSDATKITNVQVEVTQDATNTISWLRANTAAPAQPLVNGWNFLRWKLCEGLPTTFTGTTVNRVRVFTTTNAATSITIGHLYLETPARARMIFVADRGYRSFVVNGLPDLRALRVPVTWAVDVLKLGDYAGEFPNGPFAYADAVTEAEIADFAAEGDSVSFHGFTSDPTASMTAAQIRSDTVRCIKWLQARGYEGRMWRAAWVQNQATNHAAADPYILGQATWDVLTHSVALDTWPPRDFQNIARWDFYTKTLEQCNAQFDILRRTHGLMVVYNHGVGTGYAQDATQERWDNFIANVQTGISQGWLEATTFEALWAESGGEFHTTAAGANTASYVDRAGGRLAKTVL